MNLKQTRLHILQKAEDLASKAKSGVSLHCHTQHSQEMLDFVPHYAEKLPIIAYFWKCERKRFFEREGEYPDFSNAFWEPPMSGQSVYDIEKMQINETGLNAIVSLTDHDTIDAALEVNQNVDNSCAPISLEWTVPFEFGFFHVGVHNLPKGQAVDLTKTLLEFTSIKENHTSEKLAEMFGMLNDLPEVLLILNHPLWDIEIVGKELHELLLTDFLKAHGRWIHALEINGFRSWSENKAVIEMAEALGMPIATGGDRHGCKPNTVINLTKAETFEEFVEEIRVYKRSEVVLMPEYSQPLHSRQLQSFSEILKDYPEFPEGKQKWFERVHFDIRDGYGVRPLSVHWLNGVPTWLGAAIWTLGFLGSPKARPIFNLARKKIDRVPKDGTKASFEIPDLDEVLRSLSSETVS
ncbi:MAG: hypothetical protein H7070_01930 [Saprospiraceae bacterium]|nr:hypothetical protein [Pyrinomonadaceae bacterium]